MTNFIPPVGNENQWSLPLPGGDRSARPQPIRPFSLGSTRPANRFSRSAQIEEERCERTQDIARRELPANSEPHPHASFRAAQFSRDYIGLISRFQDLFKQNVQARFEALQEQVALEREQKAQVAKYLSKLEDRFRDLLAQYHKKQELD